MLPLLLLLRVLLLMTIAEGEEVEREGLRVGEDGAGGGTDQQRVHGGWRAHTQQKRRTTVARSPHGRACAHAEHCPVVARRRG
jgi:hypothetical protein